MKRSLGTDLVTLVDRKPAIGFSGLAVVLATLLVCGTALARDSDGAIQRIEHGLRPAVALEDKPVPTSSLLDEMRRLRVPGLSIAVVHDGKIVWAKGYGVTSMNGPAVSTDTLFQAASISKPVTALAALRLVDARQLGLDADINTALTSWKLPPGPGGVHATLRELLSHTAGTTVSGFPGYEPDAPVPSLLQILEGRPPANTEAVRIKSPPGRTWNYSGGGYTVVQQALIDRSGKPFAVVLEETVLGPLGMHDSRFAQPLPPALLARAAMPHDADGQPCKAPNTYPELAAAGLWTTPSDLARFFLGVQRNADERGRVLLSPSIAHTMLQPVKNGYALGFGVDGKGPARSFGHSGSNMGYQAVMFGYADHGDGVVVMTNGERGNDLIQGILRSVAAEYHWPGMQVKMRKAVALTPAQRKALIGKYDVSGMSPFEILEQDGQMMISLREGMREPLYAASPTVLFLLSRAIELRMATRGNGPGRLISGDFTAQFRRSRQPVQTH